MVNNRIKCVCAIYLWAKKDVRPSILKLTIYALAHIPEAISICWPVLLASFKLKQQILETFQIGNLERF